MNCKQSVRADSRSATSCLTWFLWAAGLLGGIGLGLRYRSWPYVIVGVVLIVTAFVVAGATTRHTCPICKSGRLTKVPPTIGPST